MHLLLGGGLAKLVGDAVDHPVRKVAVRFRNDEGWKTAPELVSKDRADLEMEIIGGDESHNGFATLMLLRDDAEELRAILDAFIASGKKSEAVTEYLPAVDDRKKKS